MRGAAEVKEHPWLKYYPWKDLYNKTLESPFKHNILEPWDQKYVNNPDKLGLETKDRYENIMRSENYKVVFNNYYFYYNQQDLNDKFNNQLKILPCDHDKLKNGVNKFANTNQIISQPEEFDKKSSGNIANVSTRGVNPSTSSVTFYKKVEGSSGGEIKIMTNIESKFSKIKQLSNTGTANNLLRQYKVSGASNYINNKFISGTGNTSQNNSFLSNSNISNNRSNSKSVAKGSIGSNSTSISNQKSFLENNK